MTVHEIRLVECEEQPTVGIRRLVRWGELTTLFSWALPAVVGALQRAGTIPAGPPFARYHATSDEGVDVEVGFPVGARIDVSALSDDLPPQTALVSHPLPGVRAAEAVHGGAYDALPETYARMEEWIGAHDLQPSGEMWELYEAGPDVDPDPATWRTRVVMPVTSAAEARGPDFR